MRCKIPEPVESGSCESAPTCGPGSEVRQGLGARGPISRTYGVGSGSVLINVEMTLEGSLRVRAHGLHQSLRGTPHPKPWMHRGKWSKNSPKAGAQLCGWANVAGLSSWDAVLRDPPGTAGWSAEWV